MMNIDKIFNIHPAQRHGAFWEYLFKQENKEKKMERKFYPTYEAEKKLVLERAEYYKQFLTDIKTVAYGLHESGTKGRVIMKFTDGTQSEVSKADDDVFNADEAVLYAYKKKPAMTFYSVGSTSFALTR